MEFMCANGCEKCIPQYSAILTYYTDDEGQTWIVLELKDRDGEPVPYENYTINLPDGSVIEGSLDENGSASIGLEPAGGPVEIDFPNLDPGSWERL
jgi:hypothetical protein